jgi:thymidylate synthase (FAD)
MQPYAELLEFNQPNPVRVQGFTRIRDQFPELRHVMAVDGVDFGKLYNPERISEFAGRWDYGADSAAKLGQESKAGGQIIKRWIASGEQSMLEMAHATVFFECSRVVTHELVRHRLASYQQESQRFSLFVVDDPEDGFFIPPDLDSEVEMAMRTAYGMSAGVYNRLLKKGVPKQLARYVLPGAARTRIIVSANLREWRHIFKLRLDKSAQPEMRQMMQMAYDQMLLIFPQSLEGITEEGRGVR